ncbi:MAG: NrtA/SsuA/CpmA family ABC transporter substrate-binding protein [Proteobacteria bacterium]|nr:NrtA/SsuA/CpmA family ABC transporter substrate-binding protein [Pseudomonadota bacterium]
MKKDKLIGLMALALLAVVAVFFPDLRTNFFQTEQQKAYDLEKVRLAVPRAMLITPAWIAVKKDFFLNEGLAVELTGEFSSGKEAFENMLAGHADISTVATTPVVANSFSRQDYSIFVTFTTTYDGVKLVARKDKGITTSKDLKGKVVGVVSGTISQIMIDSLLAIEKILPHEVIFKGYAAQVLPEALVNGEVDAIAVWEPYAYNAKQLLSKNVVQIPTSKAYRMAINMAVMNDYAAKHPDILKKVIRALSKTIDYIQAHPEDAQTIMAENQQIKQVLVNEFWRGLNFEISLDQLLLLTMENEANWIKKKRGIRDEKIPNFLDFIHYRDLEAVRPDAVTIVRKRP